MDEVAASPSVSASRVEYLRVRNFRVLRNLELRDLTPLTAFIGPNGSGKSTLFDVLAFLREAFASSLDRAVEGRFGIREIRTRDSLEPISIEARFQLEGRDTLQYEIAFDERDGRIKILSEQVTTVERDGHPVEEQILSVSAAGGWSREEDDAYSEFSPRDTGELMAPLIGRLGSNRSLNKLWRFVYDGCLFDINATDVRRIPEAGPQQRLSPTGDNVANVLEWLAERHPERLATIEARLRERVPQLESLGPVATGDGRSMLQLKDAPFDRAIPARFASEGTLKLLAYLTVLYGPEPPALMGFEEPETNLPPQLLYALAEEFRMAAGRSQVLVNTHSPAILNAFRPEEVRILYRNQAGYARAVRAADIPGVREAMDEGAALGNLWSEGFLRVGDPTKNAGMPGPGVGD